MKKEETLEKTTVTDKLSRVLADEILMGSISPGTHLNESSLAKRFSVSRTPVREALGQIVAFGLAERRLHHGVFVIEATSERLADMFELTSDIEGNCARHAAGRMSGEEREQLKKLHEETEGAALAEDVANYEQFNLQFHEQICKGSHNSYLVEAANVAKVRVLPYRRAQFRAQKRVLKSYQEHGEILEAILASDGELAEYLMRQHLVQSLRTSQDIVFQVLGRW